MKNKVLFATVSTILILALTLTLIFTFSPNPLTTPFNSGVLNKGTYFSAPSIAVTTDSEGTYTIELLSDGKVVFKGILTMPESSEDIDASLIVFYDGDGDGIPTDILATASVFGTWDDLSNLTFEFEAEDGTIEIIKGDIEEAFNDFLEYFEIDIFINDAEQLVKDFIIESIVDNEYSFEGNLNDMSVSELYDVISKNKADERADSMRNLKDKFQEWKDKVITIDVSSLTESINNSYNLLEASLSAVSIAVDAFAGTIEDQKADVFDEQFVALKNVIDEAQNIISNFKADAALIKSIPLRNAVFVVIDNCADIIDSLEIMVEDYEINGQKTYDDTVEYLQNLSDKLQEYADEVSEANETRQADVTEWAEELGVKLTDAKNTLLDDIENTYKSIIDGYEKILDWITGIFDGEEDEGGVSA